MQQRAQGVLLLSVASLFVGVPTTRGAELFPADPEADQRLPPELDDVSSPEFHLSLPVTFYGTSYRSVYVNDNGILSFLTEVPAFFNAQFPLTFPIIAPFYADVDTRGSGHVSYRESRDPELLARVREVIQSHFSVGTRFEPGILFIATWTDVGHFEQKTSLRNTFQAVIATDGRDSYVIFVYPDGGINWTRGDGKNPNLPDARAQAGFISGDGRMVALPGSGTQRMLILDRMSNVMEPGLWVFHVSPTEGAVGPDIGLPDPKSPTSCSTTMQPCPPTSECQDYETGFCCACSEGFYGNGWSCLEKDQPLRLNGKLSGVLNEVPLRDADVHAYIVTADGRAYSAISNVPPAVGFDMQALSALAGAVSWLFAVPHEPALNGFMITGGRFNKTTNVKFPQTGHHVSIHESYLGLDVFGYMRAVVEVRGSLPSVTFGSRVEMADYEEEFTRVAAGIIRSQSSRTFRMEGGASLEIPVEVDQTIHYTECPHAPSPQAPLLRLKVGRNFIVYDNREQIVRYATSNQIVPPSVDRDPCREGKTRCGPHQHCIVDGDSYRCVCEQGYSLHYETNQPVCTDIDECSLGLSNCHPRNGECINMPGTFTCRCKAGFSGNGIHCERALTCAEMYCDVNADCVEGYGCQCRPGFMGDGHSCVPECVPACHAYAECVFRVGLGVYGCVCLPGYEGDGVDCRPTPTCERGCHADAQCIPDRTEGRYVCACKPGFLGDGYLCVPETQVPHGCDTVNNCHPNAQCVFDGAAYRCQCELGYTGDGYRCVKTEEASCNIANNCSPYARCVPDPYLGGKYVCQCQEGYDGDGFVCSPIDECNTFEDCDSNAGCAFDPATQRYRCVCNPGFSGNGKTCSSEVTGKLKEEPPCWGHCDENADCLGDGTCRCRAGYTGDGRTCQPIPSCHVVNTCSVYADCTYDRCVCWAGYDGDGYSCWPRRTCREDPYICDRAAECIQVGSEFRCQCRSGWVGDGLTCREAPQPHDGDFLVFGQGMSILRVPYHPTRSNPGHLLLMEPRQTVIGLDVDCQEGRIYWSDVTRMAIRSCRLDGSDSRVIYSGESIQSPEGVAVDWVSRNVYWTDSIRDVIMVGTLDGSYHRVLIQGDLMDPRGIALHLSRGKLFWSDWSRVNPKIESANLDGTERRVLVSEGLGLPNMVAVDLERDELCWTDAGLGKIECMGVDGSRRRVVYTPAPYPFGLAVVRGQIYWTDWERPFIQKVDKNGGEVELYDPPLGGNGKLFGIVSVPSQCPAISNPCAVQKGRCQYLCLPDGRGGRTCACPDNVDCNLTH